MTADYMPAMWALQIEAINPSWLQKGLEGLVAGLGTVLGADLAQNQLSPPIDYVATAAGGFILGALTQFILPSEPRSLAALLLAGIAAGFVFQAVLDVLTGLTSRRGGRSEDCTAMA